MKKLVAPLIAAALSIAASTASAQAWPDRPGRIVVPFSTGGAADGIARLVADGLTAAYGQPFVVENRPGAGGSLATGIVAKAKPDGYTLGLASFGTQVVAPVLMKLSFDPAKDLIPVVNVASFANLLLVNPGVPANNLQEFLQIIRRPDNRINFASSGVGANNHIFCEAFLASSRATMNHVPYKGSAPALTDLIGGQVQAMCDVSSALTHVRTGKARLLAVGEPRRLAEFPNVPTMAEAGFPEANFSAWYGITVPAGTPRDIVLKINTAVNDLLKTERARTTLTTLDAQPLGGTPEDFARAIESGSANIVKVIRERNIKPEQ